MEGNISLKKEQFELFTFLSNINTRSCDSCDLYIYVVGRVRQISYWKSGCWIIGEQTNQSSKKSWNCDFFISREAVNCQYGGHGGSLLHAAVAEGDRKAASLLIAAGARFLFIGKLDWKKFWSICASPRVDLPDSSGRTALHIAAGLGNKVLNQLTKKA